MSDGDKKEDESTKKLLNSQVPNGGGDGEPEEKKEDEVNSKKPIESELKIEDENKKNLQESEQKNEDEGTKKSQELESLTGADNQSETGSSHTSRASKSPRSHRRYSSRRARFSIRSRKQSLHGSAGGREGDILEEVQDVVEPVEDTSKFILQTTEEQSGADALSMLSDAGSVFGSSALLSTPTYLDIYAQTIQKEIGGQLDIIQEDEEPLPEDHDDIFDNPEYVRTCAGNLQLAQVARMVAKDKAKYGELFDKSHISRNRRDYNRRILVISLSFLLIYSSFYGMRNAQSSLGTDRQLALLGYAAVFSLMWFGAVCAKPIMSRYRPKHAMAIASISFVMYPLSNFFPRYYTLLPVALLTGFSSGLIWACEGVYVMNVASAYALVTDGNLVKVIARFNGIIFSLFLSSNIFGNLLASVILGNFYYLPGESEFRLAEEARLQNLTHSHATTPSPNARKYEGEDIYQCGLHYHPDQPPISIVYNPKKYLFLGIETLLAVIGSALLFFALRPLKVALAPGSDSMKEAMKRFVRMFKEVKALLMVPLMMYFGIMVTLILSDFNAAFIACQYGVGVVGFMVMLAYTLSIFSAFAAGKLVAVTGRPVVFCLCAVVSLGAIVCILLWKPQEGDGITIVAFIPLCLWGMSDGALYTQSGGFLSVLFKKRAPEALAMQTLFLAVGALGSTLFVAYASMTITFKLYLAVAVNIISMAGYFTVEMLLKRKVF